MAGGLLIAAALTVAAPTRARPGGAPLRSSPIQVDDEGFVFVVNPDSNSVTRLSPLSGGTLGTLWEGLAGEYPRTLTLAGDSVYTANQNDDSVSRLARADGSRRQPDAALGFGCAPYGISANRDGDRLYVSCQGTQELVVLGTDLTLVARIRLDWPAPRAVAVSGDGTRVFVSHFLTVEPNDDAHVSEIDATADQLTARRYLTIPADRSTCETQSSGQGVTNLVGALALTPSGSAPEVADQLWVGGTLQNNLTKGLFERFAGFKGQPGAALFDLPCPADDLSVSCRFEAFPRSGTCGGGTDAGLPCARDADCAGASCRIVPDSSAARKRNLYKSSLHDITRFVIWKLDLATGNVVGKIDVDGASNASDIAFSPDGAIAYVVDQMFNSFHVFNSRRGQGRNPATLFARVAKYGRFGADPSRPCDADALGSVTAEQPFISGFEPQVQITTINAGDPVRVDAGVAKTVETGVDFDTAAYHTSRTARMRHVPDGVGTAPIGVALSPDGCVAYVANYLARNVVPVSARPGDPACAGGGQTIDFRCAGDFARSCESVLGCTGSGSFCRHPGGRTCVTDADCPAGEGPCIGGDDCVPLVAGEPVQTVATDPVPPEILDGKILFNTAARDGSVPNGVGLDRAAPLFNHVRKGCARAASIDCETDRDCGFCASSTATACRTAVDCPGGSCTADQCNVVKSLPGEVVSVAHEASYVSCSACHADFGGHDGRTWDFSQFGASLRNTMDLRGRAQEAPGTCDPARSTGPPIAACHFDAECGSGSAPGACVGNPAMAPADLDDDSRQRFFNPMVTIHWNGDRIEVEGFEFTFRSLLGAGDCDGLEHDPNGCLGALVPRSPLISTAALPADGRFESDLHASLRNVMVDEPTLGTKVNASIRLSHVADFVYSLTRFPRNPFLGAGETAVSAAAERGRHVFNDRSTRCATCHNGPSAADQLFSDKGPNTGFAAGEAPGAAPNNPFKRRAVGTANLFDRTDPAMVADENGRTFQDSVLPIPGHRGALLEYVTPPLSDVWITAPYLHDGSAPTLLDVIRPCDPRVTDCDQKGLGRNIAAFGGVGQHGITVHLTPQQLNDLVAFQKAPHSPVRTDESTIKAGELVLKTVRLKFGKRAGGARFAIVGTANPGVLRVDPRAGGLGLTLGVPQGEEMAMIEFDVPADAVRGSGSRFGYRSCGSGAHIAINLRRTRTGEYRVVATGRRTDLAVINNGARDVTVAVVAGGAQFVQNRVLTARKRGRVLELTKKRPRKRRHG